MHKHRIMVAVLTLSMLLVGCGTSKVNLRYDPYSTGPGTAAAADAPRIEIGAFVDQRNEPSDWLGSIRGGFGNPLKSLESVAPVSQIVARMFADGLQARHYAAGAGKGAFQLSGVIRKLDCNQYVQREANVEIEVVLTSAASGRQMLSRTYAATNYERSGLAVGAFASPEDLRSLLERTLQEAVNKALDDTAFRSALRG